MNILNPIDRLEKQIPQIKEYFDENILNIIPAYKNLKMPLGVFEKDENGEIKKIGGWNKWRSIKPKYEYFSKYFYINSKGQQKEIYGSNIGVLIGENVGETNYLLCCIDIDGIKKYGEKTHKESVQVLYDILKDIPNTYTVKTPHGYHLYYKSSQDLYRVYGDNEDADHKTGQYIICPNDFFIKEMRGQPLNSLENGNAIEVFTHNNKQMVFIGSKYEGAEYKLLSDNFNIKEIEPIKDIEAEILKVFKANGYTIKDKPVTIKTADVTKDTSENVENGGTLNSLQMGYDTDKPILKKDLTADEVDEVAGLLIDIGKRFKSINHNLALAIGGYFSRHISQGSAEQITNKVIKSIPFKDNGASFKTTVLYNYSSESNKKKGLPSISDYLKKSGLFNETEADFYIMQLEKNCNMSAKIVSNGVISLKDIHHQPKDKDLIANALQLEQYYNMCINEDTGEKTFFNYETEKYENLTTNSYGLILRDNFNMHLFDNELDKMLQIVRRTVKPNADYINFDNGLVNTADKFKMTSDHKAVYTVKNLSYNFYDYKNEPGRWQETTLIEKTLRQLLIPGKEPNNEKLYIDFLQRLGASFLRENIHKKATLYLGDGNNGRGILKHIIELVFQDLGITIRPNALTDNFFKRNLANTNVILMDELDTDSFKRPEILANYKDITGRGADKGRKMHTDNELLENKNYGMLWLFSNTAPFVPFSETAYWRRTDLLILPNTFLEDISQDNPNENEFKADPNLDIKLDLDTDGIEWLISRSVYEYKRMREKHKIFLLNQTAEQSQFKYDGSDPLRIFLTKYIIRDKSRTDMTLSNRIIRYHFINWALKENLTGQGIGITGEADLSRVVRTKMENLFGKIESTVKPKNQNGQTSYVGFILNIDTDIKLDTDLDLELYDEMVKEFFDVKPNKKY